MLSDDSSISRFRSRIVASVLLPSGVFSLALIISLTLLGYLWEANRAISHSELVLAQGNETFRRVATSEAAVRGYLLYGRPRSLESYEDAKVKLWGEMDNNREQQAALQELRAPLEQFLDFSDRALEARKAGRQLAWSDEQEALAVRIRDSFQGFWEREQRVRVQRRERSQDLVERSVGALALGVIGPFPKWSKVATG